MKTIPEIKALCQEVIRLGEKASPSPWIQGSGVHDDVIWVVPSHQPDKDGFAVGTKSCSEDAAFIAFSRTFTPQAARALLVAIDVLERIDNEGAIHTSWLANGKLTEICKLFD